MPCIPAEYDLFILISLVKGRIPNGMQIIMGFLFSTERSIPNGMSFKISLLFQAFPIGMLRSVDTIFIAYTRIPEECDLVS